jgi:hypothetical protein
MATKKITSLEVAKLAGVSQSAFSRVFTPGAFVSKKIFLSIDFFLTVSARRTIVALLK